MKAKEAPDRIWMACVGDVLVPGLAGFGLSCKTEKIRSEDIPYIRLDLHDKQIKALRDALECSLSSLKQGLLKGNGPDVETEHDMLIVFIEQALEETP